MTDVNQLITEHLDVWTSAIDKKSSAGRGSGGGLELYGIKKLRELIFELAVRGKLVPQSAEDQSVELLLRAINQERATVLSDPKCVGKWSKPTGFVEPQKNIPPVWKWVALADVLNWHVGGGTPSKTRADYWNGGIPWASVKDVGKSKYLDQTIDDISSKGLANSSSNIVPKGSLLVVTRMGLGKLSVNEIDVAINQDIRALSVSSVMNLDYCYLFLKTHKMEGAGLTVKGVKVGQLLSAEFPLPPIEEQDRIVAKVDELMALCDALEQRAEDSLKAHQTLVETCLATLTNSGSPEELTQNWTRIEAHFDTLFTTEESVQALEAAIIELGVTGLLVPQSEADEPATLLLQRVAKEVAAYSKLNKVRPVKPTKITEQESQAERLPSGWVETRLSSLFRVVTDGDHQAPPRASDGVAFLTIGNISSGQLNFEGCRRVPDDYYKGLPAYRTPGLGDILYTVVGATYGRPVLVETEEQFCVQRHIAILKPSVELDVDYLVWMLKSAWVYNQAREGITGSAQPTLALKPLRNFLVLLPPRAQQERISAKIKQLHQLTARLRERISVSTETQVSLANTITSKIH